MPTSKLPLLPLVLDRVPPGLRLALSQEGVPWVSRKTSAIAGRFVLYDSQTKNGKKPAQPVAISPGQTRIDIHELRAGEPVDPFMALTDDRAVRMAWDLAEHDLPETTVSEEVSRYDKRAIRDRLLRRLRQRIESHGGLWLRLSPVPFPYRTAFHLRVDHDRFDPGDFNRLLDTLAGYENCVTHYLNGQAVDHFSDDAIARLDGLDVGSHGYYHHTYRTVEENLQNLRRGIETISRRGIDPVGFVAPCGRYNASLQAAMATLGISHAGEFGLAYDDWPFWPVRKGSGSTDPAHDVLQIPVHPICLGLFDDPQSWLDHWTREAQARYSAGEPLFFYGHPTGRLGRYPELLARFLHVIDGMETVWKTTAHRMAEWWRARATVRLSVHREGDTLVVRREGPRPKFRLAIELFRKDRSALVAMQDAELRFAPEAIAWQRHATFTDLKRPAGHPCRLSLRDRLKRAIDWEKETPIEEILLDDWRSRCKRTLRELFRNRAAL